MWRPYDPKNSSDTVRFPPLFIMNKTKSTYITDIS